MHISELECANKHLSTCESDLDIENVLTWIRIIKMDLEIVKAENQSSLETTNE